MTNQEKTLLENINGTIGSVFETVNFIKDHAVTREEFNEKIDTMNNKIDSVEERLHNKIDDAEEKLNN